MNSQIPFLRYCNLDHLFIQTFESVVPKILVPSDQVRPPEDTVLPKPRKKSNKYKFIIASVYVHSMDISFILFYSVP